MKDDDIAISVNGVSKAFKLPHEKQNSVKGLFVNMFRGKRTFERQQVLKDISFDIKKGEFFGIVGRNGSGKSTLLKLMAGIYTPDKGHIQVNGKLTPFIELGVGFNPELTGRENVFLNGALLGFNRKEMEAMYDEIVAFAELEKFMDQKLKNYSSGMQVRLAFSIAIRAQSDILVLDEVLAVGDSAFQSKCLEYFRKLKKEKQTVVLVSHDMKTIERFCNKAILINAGEIVNEGNPDNVAAKYEQLNLINYQAPKSEAVITKNAEIIDVTIEGRKNIIIAKNRNINIDILFKTQTDAKVAGSISISSSGGEFLANVNTLNNPKNTIVKKNKPTKLCYSLNTEQFLNGTYRVDIALYEGNIYLDRLPGAVSFSVTTEKDNYKQGLFKLKGEWSMENVK